MWDGEQRWISSSAEKAKFKTLKSFFPYFRELSHWETVMEVIQSYTGTHEHMKAFVVVVVSGLLACCQCVWRVTLVCDLADLLAQRRAFSFYKWALIGLKIWQCNGRECFGEPLHRVKYTARWACSMLHIVVFIVYCCSFWKWLKISHDSKICVKIWQHQLICLTVAENATV